MITLQVSKEGRTFRRLGHLRVTSSSSSILRESKLHPLISIDSPICTKPPCKLAVQFGIHDLSIFPKELETNILPNMQNAQKTSIREKKSTFFNPSLATRRRVQNVEAKLHHPG